MANDNALTRRDVMLGRIGANKTSRHHVSSAIVRALPSLVPDLSQRLAEMPGVEVVASGEGKIVLVLEGSGPGELGEKLTTINLMGGVLAASMVFEQAVVEEEMRHDTGAQPT
ncbi:chaperone NapD [Devosia sp. XJ19-1]|uniref:Chaperone NapD n=1 Tax=Devosia ureilytica TaxID=2952754 RepID=A0A9Q4ASG6_9HYPH|nr:chaperone NapD [Devosia ureilytica]MCP8885055.1 chaperone NapD [Devosia ureilytica]MCP8889025.1 chaperone NapD [Devosia ureilytica]